MSVCNVAENTHTPTHTRQTHKTLNNSMKNSKAEVTTTTTTKTIVTSTSNEQVKNRLIGMELHVKTKSCAHRFKVGAGRKFYGAKTHGH